MKLKDHYSLCIDNLKTLTADLSYPASTTPDLPTIQEVQHDFKESLDCIQAFGDYLIERNRTKALKKQIHTAQRALDVWNEETEKQVQDRLNTAEQRFQCFLAEEKKKFEQELQQSVLEASDQAETMSDDNRKAHFQHQEVKKVLEMYRTYLSDLDKQLVFLKKDAAADVRNLYFQRLADDYEKKASKIQKYLTKWR
ncbi:hypothetical protein ACE418_12935 [Megasphaera sp. WILCCON 0056]|uniref:hypothetical protein n=1 Tax=Megasphaera sp. WILCCON 0056 TaxID=3345340 RepID=UPI003A7F83BB